MLLSLPTLTCAILTEKSQKVTDLILQQIKEVKKEEKKPEKVVLKVKTTVTTNLNQLLEIILGGVWEGGHRGKTLSVYMNYLYLETDHITPTNPICGGK